MKIRLICLTILLAACGNGINKKGPKLASNNQQPSNNVANNGTASGSNNNTTVAQNNTVIDPPNNNTVVDPNNINNTVVDPNNNTNNRDWSTCYTDSDGDGYGVNEQMIDAPCTDVGLVWDGGDCNDSDSTAFPGAADLCDGIDRGCDGSWVPAVPDVCATLQAAIDASNAYGFMGDVPVAAGTYFENIIFKGAPIRLLGAGPTVTTIDGSNLDESTVRFADFEGPDSVLEGFSITGGNGHVDVDRVEGGGIWIDEADPTLRNLIVHNNRADGSSGYGGGISLSRSESLVEQVDIIGNRSGYYGGGLHLALSDATIRQVRLIDNESVYGGGVAVYFSNASFVSVTVAANRGALGGGAMLQGDLPVFYHAAFVANEADEGGAVKLLSNSLAAFENVSFTGNSAEIGGAIDNESGSPVVDYSNFFGNGPEPLVNLSVSLFEGLIQQPPGYVSTTGDPHTWDLHLQQSSALIDAGNLNATDYDGTRADIGAYGGQYGDW